MSLQFYRLTPIEPIVLGDGRPMDRQKGEVWPVPASFAAAINGWAGEMLTDRNNKEFRKGLQESVLWGPLLMEQPETKPVLLLPPPADMKISPKGEFIRGTFKCASQSLWPEHFALPKLYFLDEKGISDAHKGRIKLKDPNDELDWEESIAWAFGQKGSIRPEDEPNKHYENRYKNAARIHVGIGKGTFTADPGVLFRSPGVSLAPPLSYVFGWKGPPILKNHQPRMVQLGGEGRMASLEMLDSASQLPLKAPVQVFPSAFLRIQLLTPALFHAPAKTHDSPQAETPFLPGWLGQSGACDRWVGQPPGSPELRLVAMTLGRFRAFSGWQYKKGIQSPREVRRLVPAGSVYWFGDRDGNPLEPQALQRAIEAFWLKPFCSLANPLDTSRLGFGLCLPGFTLEKSSL